MSVRLAFLVEELGRSGGMKVIEGYARALAERGDFAPELIVTGPRRDDLPADHGGIPVVRLEDARRTSRDVLVATWWATAGALYDLDARSRVVFLQSIENRFYDERDYPLRFGAEGVLALPVQYVAVAGWIRDLMSELCPGARCALVRNGIDKRTFAPRRPDAGGTGPLRVLVEGQPELWFKAVQEAIAAVREMSEPAEVTAVAGDPGAARELGADRVAGGLDHAGMAALYAEHDVLLKLSRVESLGLPPVEGMHVGLPAVTTPFSGHEEYMEHGRNGFVVGYDDRPGTVRTLDLLARDRDLLARLAAGAVESVAEWPSSEQAADDFARVLLEALEQPAPSPDGALACQARAERRWLALSRQYARQAAVALDHAYGAVRWHEHALEQANETVRSTIAERDRTIAEIREERAYRLALAARNLLHRTRELRPGDSKERA